MSSPGKPRSSSVRGYLFPVWSTTPFIVTVRPFLYDPARARHSVFSSTVLPNRTVAQLFVLRPVRHLCPPYARFRSALC